MKRRQLLATGSMLIAMGALSGCATVSSSQITRASETEGSIGTGIAYFLPRQLATVTVSRSPQKVDTARTALSTALTALTASEAELTAARNAESVARTALATGQDNDNAVRILGQDLALAHARVGLASTATDTARAAYTAAVTKLQDEFSAAQSTNPFDYNVTVAISLSPPEADPRFAFRLTPLHSVLRDDEARVEVGTNGLLKSTHIVAADRTADIAVSLGSFIGGRVMGAGAAGGAPATPCDNVPASVSLVVDLADQASVDAVSQAIRCYGTKLVVSNTPLPSGVAAMVAANASSSSSSSSSSGDHMGIAYRTPVGVQVAVQRCENRNTLCLPAADWEGLTRPPAATVGAVSAGANAEGWRTTRVETFMLPQAGPVTLVPQDAGMFTQTTYDLAFDNGILTSYSSNRPGEIENLAEIPQRLVTSAFAAGSQMLSLQLGRTNSLREIANARALLEQAGVSNEAAMNTALLSLLNSEGQLARAGAANETLTNQALLNLLNSQGQLQSGAVTNENQLLTALIAQLGLEGQLQNGAVTNENQLLTALIAQLGLEGQLQNGAVTNENQLLTLLIARMGLQGQLSNAQVAAPSQLANAQFAAMINDLQLRLRTQAIEACIAAQIAAGTAGNVATCLPVP